MRWHVKKKCSRQNANTSIFVKQVLMQLTGVYRPQPEYPYSGNIIVCMMVYISQNALAVKFK